MNRPHYTCADCGKHLHWEWHRECAGRALCEDCAQVRAYPLVLEALTRHEMTALDHLAMMAGDTYSPWRR